MDQFKLNNKIFLIGFMGSGKTHWGRIWSKKWDIPFYDLDEEVEKKLGTSVSGVFENMGEEIFRRSETECLQKFNLIDKFILSCGGGTPCFNNNMKLINSMGTSIYLKCPADTLFNRLIKEKDKRPLIRNFSDTQLKDFIDVKIKEREQYYLQANIILEESEAHNFIIDSHA